VVSRFRWLAATAVAVAVAATAAASAAVAGTAKAAPAPGWRIAAVYPEDSGVGTIFAASTDNAWTVENCTRPCHTGSEGYTLRHWNGRQWQVVKAQPAHVVDGVGLLGIAPGATSRPWALYSYKTYRQTAVAHWTGTSWSAPTLLSKSVHFTVDVIPSSSAIWLFGWTLNTGKPYAVRYNGRSWRAAPAPGIDVVSASAASPTDIWVTGIKVGAAKGSWPMVVSHWNGTKWTTTVLPRVPLPAKSTAQPLSIVAGGAHSARDAWALGYKTGPEGSIVPNDGMILYRWNGATWYPVTIPYKETQAFSIDSDGHGGVWFWTEVDPGHHDYLIHDSSSGHWSEVTLPRPANAFSAQVSGFTAIPGTTSLWADGIASVPIPVGGNPGGTEGLILKYGA
jgi:hypothetical protein